MSEKQFTGKVSQMKQSSKFLASEDFLGLGDVEVTIEGVFEHADEVILYRVCKVIEAHGA